MLVAYPRAAIEYPNCMIAEDFEINIEELKNRIRAEVIRRPVSSNRGTSSPRGRSEMHGEPPSSQVLQFHLAQRGQRQTLDKLAGILEQARGKTEVKRWIPKVLRRLFRKQGGFNKLLLDSFQVLLKSLWELRNE